MNAGPPRIIPAELYLIEHFSSVEYFEPLVQDWRAMVEYLEEMLDRFMHKLPPAYRKRHLSEQPDVVWGGRCIPNFRSTLHQLEVGLEQRRAGDVGGISAASNVVSDVRGQREYSADWLAEIEGGDYAGFTRPLDRASSRASNIQATTSAGWIQNILLEWWTKPENYPPPLPEFWPTYQLDRNVLIPTDGPVQETGIYLASQPETSPNLLIKGESADLARVGLNDQGIQYRRKEPTVWTLVRRVSDTSSVCAQLPGSEMPVAADRGRIEAGEPCPYDGWWITPAKKNSRRYFKNGEIMPSFTSDYGQTIWQQDVDQSEPKL